MADGDNKKGRNLQRVASSEEFEAIVDKVAKRSEGIGEVVGEDGHVVAASLAELASRVDWNRVTVRNGAVTLHRNLEELRRNDEEHSYAVIQGHVWRVDRSTHDGQLRDWEKAADEAGTLDSDGGVGLFEAVHAVVHEGEGNQEVDDGIWVLPE
jgi:hypothetical protein